jgi:hypothetical protein
MGPASNQSHFNRHSLNVSDLYKWKNDGDGERLLFILRSFAPPHKMMRKVQRAALRDLSLYMYLYLSIFNFTFKSF